MTPEDKIVEAIDRLTDAIKSYSTDVFFANVLHLALFGAVAVIAGMVGCPQAKSSLLLPALEQPVFVDIGEPPAPLPNPNVQYWHTQYVPGPDGVLPVEVFAPRLVANMANEPQGVETPEPGTGWAIGGLLMLLVSFAVLNHIARKAIHEWELWAKQAVHYRLALNEIYWNSGDDVAAQEHWSEIGTLPPKRYRLIQRPKNGECPVCGTMASKLYWDTPSNTPHEKCSMGKEVCIGPNESRRIDCEYCGNTFRQWAEGKEPKR